MTLVRFTDGTWRIRFQGASTAYWHYSGSFATLTEAQDAISRIERARRGDFS